MGRTGGASALDCIQMARNTRAENRTGKGLLSVALLISTVLAG